jgi:DNA repair protein RecO (recombination protein O)
VLCSHCCQDVSLTHALSVNALKVLRLLQRGDYDTASKLRLNLELSAELEEVLRSYIRYLLEREVKSVAWLDMLRG